MNTIKKSFKGTGHKRTAGEENLTQKLTLRLLAEEKTALKARARKRGVTLSQFCRAVLMRYKVPDRSPETRDYLRALIGMKNNINQLAKHINTIHHIDSAASEGIAYLRAEIDEAKSMVTNDKY